MCDAFMQLMPLRVTHTHARYAVCSACACHRALRARALQHALYKIGAGGSRGGGPMRPGQGLPVVVTAGLQQGIRTQAWCYDAAAVSSVGGAANGSWSGRTSATLAGLGFGSWSHSGRARVGRGAAIGMTDGRMCEASRWRSSSGVECKLSAGVGGMRERKQDGGRGPGGGRLCSMPEVEGLKQRARLRST